MALRLILVWLSVAWALVAAKGAVVFNPVELTPRFIVIESTGGWTNSAELDINKDGVNDIRFFPSARPWEFLNGTEVMTHSSDSRMALLDETQTIGDLGEQFDWSTGSVPRFTFEDARSKGTAIDEYGSFGGLYTIGVALPKETGRQFAWIRFDFNFVSYPTGYQGLPYMLAFLYGYAYETEIGVPLAGPAAIPEPSTWALLALGGAMALFWRGRIHRRA